MPETTTGAATGEAQTATTVGATTTGGTTTTQTTTNAPAGIPWLPNATSEEVAFAQSKGWDKEPNAPAAQVFRSYHNLQKVFGADKAQNTVMLPGENADEPTVNAFYNKLGRPETPDKYTAQKFDGMDDAMSKGFVEQAHKLGITEKQLAGLHKWNEQAGAQISEKIKTDGQIEYAQQESKLKTEWGAAYDQNLQVAKEAAAKLGWTQEQIVAMQASLGYDGVMKLAHTMGKAVGESTFVNNDAGRGANRDNIMSPDQAKSELKKLQSDKEFQDAWLNKNHPKHEEMVKKKSQLSAWAAA